MKRIKCMMAFMIVWIAFVHELKAQSPGDKNNQTDPNTNYKDQIPVGRGNKFKDSFKNERKEDLAEGNYKQQQPKRQPKRRPGQNFSVSKRTNNRSSKHPYGL